MIMNKNEPNQWNIIMQKKKTIIILIRQVENKLGDRRGMENMTRPRRLAP